MKVSPSAAYSGQEKKSKTGHVKKRKKVPMEYSNLIYSIVTHVLLHQNRSART
jgi:hypothetical protein